MQGQIGQGGGNQMIPYPSVYIYICINAEMVGKDHFMCCLFRLSLKRGMAKIPCLYVYIHAIIDYSYYSYTNSIQAAIILLHIAKY